MESEEEELLIPQPIIQ